MKKNKVLFFALLLFLFLASSQLARTEQQPKLKIITTIYPLTELVQNITGDRGEVFQLIPTGAEVHNFQLRPSDVAQLRQADLLVAVGPALEPWLPKIETALGRKIKQKIYFFDELKKVGFPGLVEQDPHLWLDLKADDLLVKAVVNQLAELDPKGRLYYSERGQKLRAKISNLDREFQEQLANCRSNIFIVAGHQAFGYLARRYHLQLVSLVGANPESRPGLKKIQEIIELIKKEQVKAIFYESSVTPYYARAIAQETGIELYPLSTGVHLRPEEIKNKIGFLQLMKQNLETLKKALGCSGRKDRQ
ncbi:MAG: zinc ABC transporter substrate-binding protein [Candidatus Aminicenantes bacterium]|nr:zinc ABC transporter substrate-binding protein [Candidatus Aminicenantes bacterium]